DDDNKGHRDELDRMKAAARQRKTAKEAEKAAWAMASRVKDIVGELTLPEKKELVRASVEMVTVHSQHEIDIECILPTEAVMVTAGDLPPSCYNRHVWNPGP
ncbi:MAG: hypothetical protein IH797_04615, partial [Chloroflexi bacterium]|nr:hypothetical protein [Chloroflexota bacterium]